MIFLLWLRTKVLKNNYKLKKRKEEQQLQLSQSTAKPQDSKSKPGKAKKSPKKLKDGEITEMNPETFPQSHNDESSKGTEPVDVYV